MWYQFATKWINFADGRHLPSKLMLQSESKPITVILVTVRALLNYCSWLPVLHCFRSDKASRFFVCVAVGSLQRSRILTKLVLLSAAHARRHGAPAYTFVHLSSTPGSHARSFRGKAVLTQMLIAVTGCVPGHMLRSPGKSRPMLQGGRPQRATAQECKKLYPSKRAHVISLFRSCVLLVKVFDQASTAARDVSNEHNSSITNGVRKDVNCFAHCIHRLAFGSLGPHGRAWALCWLAFATASL